MKTKNCGIYYIQNKITKQLYIGQSKTLRLRRNRQFSHLRKNKHHNSHLQNSFNKYGEKNFEYGIIQYCKEEELDELEVAYMNLFNVKKYGFNLSDGGHNGGYKKEYAHISLSSFNRHGQRMYKLTYNGQIIRSNNKSFLEQLLEKYFDEQGFLKEDCSFEDLKKEAHNNMSNKLIKNARIVKKGFHYDKQNYCLKYNDCEIKTSVHKEFLEHLLHSFFDENKLLKKDFTIDDVKQARLFDVRRREKIACP